MHSQIRTTPEKAVEGLLTAQQIINYVTWTALIEAGFVDRATAADMFEGISRKHPDPFVQAILGGLATSIAKSGGSPDGAGPKLTLITGGRDDAA